MGCFPSIDDYDQVQINVKREEKRPTDYGGRKIDYHMAKTALRRSDELVTDASQIERRRELMESWFFLTRLLWKDWNEQPSTHLYALLSQLQNEYIQFISETLLTPIDQSEEILAQHSEMKQEIETEEKQQLIDSIDDKTDNPATIDSHLSLHMNEYKSMKHVYCYAYLQQLCAYRYLTELEYYRNGVIDVDMIADIHSIAEKAHLLFDCFGTHHPLCSAIDAVYLFILLETIGDNQRAIRYMQRLVDRNQETKDDTSDDIDQRDTETQKVWFLILDVFDKNCKKWFTESEHTINMRTDVTTTMSQMVTYRQIDLLMSVWGNQCGLGQQWPIESLIDIVTRYVGKEVLGIAWLTELSPVFLVPGNDDQGHESGEDKLDQEPVPLHQEIPDENAAASMSD